MYRRGHSQHDCFQHVQNPCHRWKLPVALRRPSFPRPPKAPLHRQHLHDNKKQQVQHFRCPHCAERSGATTPTLTIVVAHRQKAHVRDYPHAPDAIEHATRTHNCVFKLFLAEFVLQLPLHVRAQVVELLSGKLLVRVRRIILLHQSVDDRVHTRVRPRVGRRRRRKRGRRAASAAARSKHSTRLRAKMSFPSLIEMSLINILRAFVVAASICLRSWLHARRIENRAAGRRFPWRRRVISKLGGR
mmetsp:Transcript_8177/g.19752  ORF Transcript_8177/g.19752 Transcript_8177/m.19752 type:complete len:245 (-) Transcript_8177:627-1361(-)